ncbi:hypothetical protein BO83DRAFT_429458 [Aspergillus eucalypticola CBS 122712]|uniref:Zn(2)-C6 fungal-type domain-containing protein n=1 Tax=Aspergillus eucalypticola (strain CBS 122712 / IBT 29274) TaxID=1448314 RepID=A0A317V2G6_ASPEC|nr:uncharacterized protein BO83DRAFT_429458 [Aspergillus eucalypticola CBS 122712]PWY67839.1 hypothetical protein BO83DRAFT_429458 [Aspergillus eucalypticola CBS 122712]
MTASEEASPATRARKIRKVTRACDACKAKKKACTGNIPCGPCSRRHLACTYDSAYNRGVALSPPPSSSRTKNHRPLREHGISRSFNPDPAPDVIQPLHSPPVLRSVTDCSRPGLQSSPASGPGTLPESAILDASVRRGSVDGTGQYWGPSSAHSFLGRVVEDLHASPSKPIAPAQDPDGSATVSIFSHGDRVVPEVHLSDFVWPGQAKARSLIRRYFEFAAPTYRVLHQPTIHPLVQRLYQDYPEGNRIGSQLDVASQAVVLLLLSTAAMFRVDEDGRMRDADEDGWRNSELYYAQAEHLLSLETGAPTLASVQARFLMVLYLLSSSRAQKAWFVFGTTVQLMMALGLHNRWARRHHEEEENLVQQECQRRLVWCSYTLDKYLSVILGRPRLWHDEDLDGDLPTRVNDEDLTTRERRLSRCDCVMDAPVFHAILAQILTQAAKEPYVLSGLSDWTEVETIQGLCGKVAKWQAELPPFLSGVIQPSSLVPVFRRQLTVLQLARHHALMFITRPLLLLDYGQMWPEHRSSYRYHLHLCLTAAREAIELILGFVREDELFPAFWYSQYIAFNALSIIYLYLIQVRRNRLPSASLDFVRSPEHTLHAARNAPSWKYSVILQGLRHELARLGSPMDTGDAQATEPIELSRPPFERSPRPTEDRGEVGRREQQAEATAVRDYDPDPNMLPTVFSGLDPAIDPGLLDPRTQSLLDTFIMGENVVLDFWPQLESLPISYPG